jgi:putative CocE/NonD family hydrolase
VFWLRCSEHYEKIPVPAHTFGGWFDILVQGTINGYIGMSTRGKGETARTGSRMIVGAWGHGPSRKHGDLDFGERANVDRTSVELRWFDHWLKGIDTGMLDEPPVSVFVMGRNQWRQTSAYPLPETKYTKLYLDSGGRANSYRGDGRLRWDPPSDRSPADQYRYNPNHPVPSHGGSNCCGAPTPAGPRDQRPIEKRNDVLVYTSDILGQPVEIAGPVKVVLYASSDAPDTDFVAKLVDVYPDGKAYNLCEGLLPARYREGLSAPRYLESGKVYEFTIDLIGTANVFQPGHRIRLDIAGSHFPQFARSLNTDEPFGKGTKIRVAEQSVHHTGVRPSHVLLPVIPAE